MTDGAAPIEIRLKPDGTLDEVCCEGFHLEKMDRNAWFMSVERDGKQIAVWLRANSRGKIGAHWEWR